MSNEFGRRNVFSGPIHESIPEMEQPGGWVDPNPEGRQLGIPGIVRRWGDRFTSPSHESPAIPVPHFDKIVAEIDAVPPRPKSLQ